MNSRTATNSSFTGLRHEAAPVTKVLVADDSFYVQKYMREWLERDGDIKVVATANDGVDAVRQVMNVRPDLVFLDIRMPKLDGLAALREIMRSYPTPTLVYCEHEENETRDERLAQKAMDLGALEVIFKPVGDDIINDDGALGANLRQRARTLCKIKVVRLLQRESGDSANAALLTPPVSSMLREFNVNARSVAATMVDEAIRADVLSSQGSGERRIVLIGASTGGPDALRVVMSRVPAGFPFPIVIAQHMPRGFTADFARQLARTCPLIVTEASENDVVQPGHVYVIPGNHHVDFRGQSGFTLTPAPDNTVHTPSIDRFFRSGAARFKDGVVAVILTGIGNDGQAGARAVKAAGGCVIAQDERTSAIFGMPKAAIEAGCVDVVAPVQDVAQWIVHHSSRSLTSRTSA